MELPVFMKGEDFLLSLSDHWLLEMLHFT
jgi:hypothetical protein